MLRGSRSTPRDRGLSLDRVETPEKSSGALVAVIGIAIAIYAVFDTLIVGLPTLVLSARYDSLRVFAIAALAVVLLNVACCTWIDDHWGEWVGGSGARVERRLEKMRAKKSLNKPVSWIEQGTAGRYALAAAIVNAILVIGSARIITGKPVGRHRILVAAGSYGLIFTAVYSLCGYMLGRLITAF